MRQHGEEKFKYSSVLNLASFRTKYAIGQADSGWPATLFIKLVGGEMLLIFFLFFASLKKDQRCEATWQWQGKLLLLFLPLFQIQFGSEKDEIFQIQCGFDKERNPFKDPLQTRFWQNTAFFFFAHYTTLVQILLLISISTGDKNCCKILILEVLLMFYEENKLIG